MSNSNSQVVVGYDFSHSGAAALSRAIALAIRAPFHVLHVACIVDRHTDLDVAISNECGRLVANIVIAYNSILLSGILNRYQAAGNRKALELLKQISPVAWQHIHFLGHYAFRDKQHPIDLEAILACVNLQ